MTMATPTLQTGLRPAMILGAVAAVGLLAALILWAGLAVIGGAVVAQGQVVVRGKPKLVQSLDGGIIAAILVTEGAHVAEGQPLLRLDPTLLAINLDSARTRLAEALAHRARLEAEQQGLREPAFTPPALPFAPPDTSRHEPGQRQIFAARAELMAGRRDRLAARLEQFTSQIAGITGQIAAKHEQLSYLDTDLANLRSLSAQGLARQSQLSDLQRARADLLGQITALEAEAAQLHNAMRDSELETLQAERGFHEQVLTDLRTTTAEIDALVLEIVTRSEQLSRIEIRAPAAGIVHELQATTEGGVIAPGATILEIVPLDEGVEFELRVDPRAIDQIHPGQGAQVMLSSFDPNATPRLAGRVVAVAPGAVSDPRSGQSFYRVGLEVPGEELARLGAAALVPGMPVEAFLETGERTVLAYLLQPLTRQLGRAFREE